MLDEGIDEFLALKFSLLGLFLNAFLGLPPKFGSKVHVGQENLAAAGEKLIIFILLLIE